MERVSSGIRSLDEAIGGLMVGDNIVWVGADSAVHVALQQAFLGVTGVKVPKVFVTAAEVPDKASSRLGAEVEVLDARPRRPYADPIELERALLERGTPAARIVIDGLDVFVRRLGPERALSLFSRICPQLFDSGAICYWRAGPGSRSILEGVRSVTQCVFEASGEHLRVIKAEGRLGVQGRIFRMRVTAGELRVEQERALGRLAEGLRRLRSARGLSQSDVSRMAGVSPSAISQAEAGHRGLGLDTVVALAESAGIGVDELLGTSPDPGYVLARRERVAPRRGSTALLDDPSLGLRAYLVELGPGERGEPPVQHRGPELLVVAAGLVQIDLGAETPVMRAGDAVLATRVGVRGWRNLLAGQARLFWIPRDPLPREV